MSTEEEDKGQNDQVERTITGRIVPATRLHADGPLGVFLISEEAWDALMRVDYAEIEQRAQMLVIDSHAALEKRLVQQDFMDTSVDCAEKLGNLGQAKPRKQTAQWKRERNPFGRR